jgi:N4-(beta-N-acetylglucosaminyl)-L-asparaginase
MSRRNFIKLLGAGSLVGLSNLSFAENLSSFSSKKKTTRPIVISTWNFGMNANLKAWEVLSDNGYALDAVEKGARDAESDPTNTTVGLGGTPDRDGHVTLDACIMDEKGRAGSVACLEHIENPCSVARMIMEKTPHVMLVGGGALEFALSNGFKKTNLLTEESKQRWLEWKKTSKYETPINRENHDTIGMLAIDHNGNVCGVCTTSGMGYKMHGRVGDSPILGAGLFVDNEIGGAVATGVGELVMRTCGSFLVVENMRNGMSPEKACKAAVERIISKNVELKNTQVGFIALKKDGSYGGYSLHDGFEYAVTYNGYHKLLKTNYKIK